MPRTLKKQAVKHTLLAATTAVVTICILTNHYYSLQRRNICETRVGNYVQETNSAFLKRQTNYTIVYRNYEYKVFSTPTSYNDEGKCRGLSCKWSMMPEAKRQLVQWAPEVFQKVPSHFLANFKNPCWVRNGTELNCLPYFYIVGMFKCGTTDIWSKIVAHPDVINVPKEPHWWGPRRLGYTGTSAHKKIVLAVRNITGGLDDSSLEWYLNLYKLTAIPRLIRNKVLTTEGQPRYETVFGDASISTAYTIGLNWTKTFPNASEPIYTNAELLRAVQPHAKIILLVRDPTERAISWYWHNYRTTVDAGTFHRFVVNHIGCLTRCIKKQNLRYCAYAADCPYHVIPKLQVGLYCVYALDWIKAFSRDGLLIIRLEDWEADSLSVYRRIIQFLELRKLNGEEEHTIIKAPSRNVNRGKKHVWPKTKRILDDFYRPYNKKLSILLNDDKFLYPTI